MNEIKRELFSARLQQALRQANYSPDSPTQIARQFNIRYAGRPVTANAARKWLKGEAVPTAEKLHALAQWLGVSVGWLGSADTTTITTIDPRVARADPPLNAIDLKLVSHLKQSDEHYQLLTREVIAILAGLSESPRA